MKRFFKYRAFRCVRLPELVAPIRSLPPVRDYSVYESPTYLRVKRVERMEKLSCLLVPQAE